MQLTRRHGCGGKPKTVIGRCSYRPSVPCPGLLPRCSAIRAQAGAVRSRESRHLLDADIPWFPIGIPWI